LRLKNLGLFKNIIINNEKVIVYAEGKIEATINDFYHRICSSILYKFRQNKISTLSDVATSLIGIATFVGQHYIESGGRRVKIFEIGVEMKLISESQVKMQKYLTKNFRKICIFDLNDGFYLMYTDEQESKKVFKELSKKYKLLSATEKIKSFLTNVEADYKIKELKSVLSFVKYVEVEDKKWLMLQLSNKGLSIASLKNLVERKISQSSSTSP